MYSLADAEYFYNKKTKEVITRKDYEKLVEQATQGIKNYERIVAVERKLGYDFCYKHENGEFYTPAGEKLKGLEEASLDRLTPTETKIAELIRNEHLTNRQIGERLGIAEGTVRTHVSRILIKTGVNSRKEL